MSLALIVACLCTCSHYRIVVNPLGLSKSVKRLAQKNKVPSLGHLQDVSEYVLSAVKASESDAEDDEDARIDLVQAVKGELNRKVAGKKRRAASGGDKGAIRLQELGPRIEFTLAKIQVRVCEFLFVYVFVCVLTCKTDGFL